MKSYIINNYPNYQYGEGGLNFSHYYDGSRDWLHQHEPLLDYIKEKLQPNINTVVIFGCASGRDFLPFQDNFTCVGFDIAPQEQINWVCKTDNLIYLQCSIEDFVDNIDIFEIKWDDVLVYSHGSMMYASHSYQNKFIEILLEKGCENIVMQEYEPHNSGHNPYLNLNKKNLQLFEKKMFKDSYEGQPTAHILIK
jgi:hypothetical protein